MDSSNDLAAGPGPCPFCQIVAGFLDARCATEGPEALIIVPLNPVTEGHLLVVSRAHVTDAVQSPALTAAVMHEAVTYARRMGDVNIITSVGPAATQTVPHLHVHLVPRRSGDGLHLPWSGQDTTA